MLHRSQPGKRIRARRLEQGLSQKDLASAIGISASYLNLIEHGRRRIGAALLADVAQALEVPVGRLTGAGDAAVLQVLQERDGAEGTAEAFVEGFPSWAAAMADQDQQIAELKGRVTELTDRMAHDPVLSGALHQVLSTVTSIRSTASILVEGAGDAEWEARFHQNIHADSLRLAEVSQALVTYLEGPDDSLSVGPAEEAAIFLDRCGHRVPEIEAGGEADLSSLSAGGKAAVQGWLRQYKADAAAMPLERFDRASRVAGYDPAALAAEFSVPMVAAMRRLAQLPSGTGHPDIGMVICDAAGAIVYLKPIDGLAVPRAGGACPLWPVFEALSQPGRPLRRVVSLPSAEAPRLTAYACATSYGPVGYDAVPLMQSAMLVVADAPTQLPHVVGPGCGGCPVQECAARRDEIRL